MSDALQKLLDQADEARRDGRLEDARRHLERAVTLGRHGDDGTALARALTRKGRVERDIGNTGAALHHYEEAEELYRNAGAMRPLAHTLRHLGDIHREELRPEQAEPYIRECLSLYRADAGTPPLELANALRGGALLREVAGDAAEALKLWGEARDLYESAGVDAGVAEAEQRLARLRES